MSCEHLRSVKSLLHRWAVGLVHEWNSELYELDVGIPLRNATDSQGESRCPNQLAKYLVG